MHSVYTSPPGMYRLITRQRMKEVGNGYIIFLSRPQFSPLKEGRGCSRECYPDFFRTGTSRHPFLREHIFFCARYINDVILSEFECNCLFWDHLDYSSLLIICKETPNIVAKVIEFNDKLLEKGSELFIPDYLWKG